MSVQGVPSSGPVIEPPIQSVPPVTNVGTVSQPQTMQALSPMPQFSPGTYAPAGVFNAVQATTAVQPSMNTLRTSPQANFPYGAISADSRPY